MTRVGIAVATLMGTIIGAGILGIPYVVAKAGLIAGLIDIIGIGLLLTILNLYIGEISLRTKGCHQLTGYAEKYLGKTGKIILTIAMMIEIYGALTAYTIVEGTSIASLIGGPSFIYSLLFFIIGSLFIYLGLKTIGKAEFVMMIVLMTVIILVSIVSLTHISTSNYELGNGNVFIPYGVILFAYLGITSIPLLKEELSKNKKLVKKAILWGSLVPIGVYLLFTLSIVGIIGINGFNSLSPDERIASAALNAFVDGPIGILVNLFAILAMGTSFLALGIAMEEMYKEDYKIKKLHAWLLTLTIPLIIFLLDYFLDVTNFIQILGITGSITGGLTGIILIIMFHKAKKFGNRTPEYSIKIHWFLSIILTIIFLAGIIYSVSHFWSF